MPIVFAHRGASGYRAENTLEAFALALELGAQGLETDAWRSADGVAVLAHDRVQRDRDVTVCSARELAARGVPSVADLYARCGNDFDLCVDLRERAAGVPLLAAAEAAGAASRLLACHGDPTFLAGLRSEGAGVRLVCSTRAGDDFAGLLTRLQSSSIDVLNLRWRDWDAARVAATHDAGLEAFAWDAHTAERVAAVARLSVDAVFSNYPDRALAVIAGRTPRALARPWLRVRDTLSDAWDRARSH